jgi:hypothetical protein
MGKIILGPKGRNSALLRTVLVVVCASFPISLCAQPDETEGGEVSAFTGGILGLGSHPTFGGSAGGVISKYALALFEGSYTPLGQSTIQPWPARSTVARSHLTDFNVSFHIRIPIKHSRWSPYGIAGVGLLWDALRQETVDPHGIAVSYHWNQFNAGFHTGGGVRYFIGENWGIRPEFKVIISKETYTRASIGIFYVVPSTWP